MLLSVVLCLLTLSGGKLAHTDITKKLKLQVSQGLTLKYGLRDQNLPYFKYSPMPVLVNKRNAKLYWDRPISADKLDIMLMDRASPRFF